MSAAVLVHGVPETEQLWDDLRHTLSRDDVVAVSLPGFGRPLPDGFSPTMDGYAAWLIQEVEQIAQREGPVDLVGHDWGGGFTLRLVSLRPDLVRTWVTDAAALADVDFEWHQIAKAWQTPGDGEAVMDLILGQTVEERAAGLAASGTVGDTAKVLAAAFDRTMADAILSLYRSATEVHTRWGPDLVDIPKPGLVLIPTADPFLSEDGARRAAARAGARVHTIEGAGHWWMLEDPAANAQVLQDFWTSAPT